MYLRLCYLFLLGACCSGLAATPIYKWVDQYGKVHFSDKPQDEGAKEIELKNSIGSALPESQDQNRLEKERRLLEHFERKRDKRKQEEDKARQEQGLIRAECNRVRQTLDNYIRSPSLYEEQQDGGRKYLSSAEREAEIARLKGLLARHCE